jgi:hypothetical protein
LLPGLLEPVFQAEGASGLMSQAGYRIGEGLANQGVVIDDQDISHVLKLNYF